MKAKLILLLLIIHNFAFSQKDSLKKVSYFFYGEFYYSYDFAEPQNHEKSAFIYNHKRHNELSANLLMAKANYKDENFRGNFGIMFGNYPEYNLASEPNWAKFMYEANVGFRISKENNIWLDVGILPSHIGFESAIGTDNFTLTRSIVAENSPYYETGAKLSYTNKPEKLMLAFLLLNGWQKIKKPDGINKPSFGMQVNYKPTEEITLNYSNFFGSDKPDSLHNFRTYHNLYLQYTPNKKWAIIVGTDLGTESQDKQTQVWFSPVLVARHSFSEKSAMGFRAEYFGDNNQLIISNGQGNSTRILGLSSNFDYRISSHLLWRTELKNYTSDCLFFSQKKDNQSVTTSLCIIF